MKNNLRLYELEEASKHIPPSPRNEYVTLPLQEHRETGVQLSRSFH